MTLDAFIITGDDAHQVSYGLTSSNNNI
jgi:hypothetical protein